MNYLKTQLKRAPLIAALCVFAIFGMAVKSTDLSMEVLGRSIQYQTKSITASTTLTAGDANKLLLVGAADLTVTLPATSSKGRCFTFFLQNAGLSASTGLSISPVAADAIHGNGLTSVDNKDLILAGATDREGDTVTLCEDGADGWYIKSVLGTWSKEA